MRVGRGLWSNVYVTVHTWSYGFKVYSIPMPVSCVVALRDGTRRGVPTLSLRFARRPYSSSCCAFRVRAWIDGRRAFTNTMGRPRVCAEYDRKMLGYTPRGSVVAAERRVGCRSGAAGRSVRADRPFLRSRSERVGKTTVTELKSKCE